ncbi:uncharacterized protein LOC144867648 [Branchiostoma floridae x Branchiostoma japonicum]
MTRLSDVAEELRELDLMFKSGSDLDVVEKGFARKLIHAISTEDEVLECEALKSLGDLYLQKAKSNDQRTENFNKACGLYTEVLRYCRTADEKQVIEHRIKYAVTCTKLKYCPRNMKSDIEALDNITLSVSMELHKLKEKTNRRGYGAIPLVEAYTKYFVAAIVSKSKRQEIESLKSIGDLYLDKGRVGRNNAAFNKAVGLYRAALDRCEDSDGRETLKHRIKYADKVKRRRVKKQQKVGLSMFNSSTTKSQATNDVIQQRNGDGVDETQANSEKPQKDTDSDYTEQLQEGCRALQTGDLDTAEQNFAAALKAVHVKNSSTDEYKAEAKPLCKLADVYLERGMQSKDGSDFTKAAALCNAALVRAKIEDREGIKQTILRVNKLFIEHVFMVQNVVGIGDSENHKSILKKDRKYVEDELKRIEQEVDPYTIDDNDPTIREVEKKRAEAIKALFQTIVQQRRMFIAGLVDECMGVMGLPPCKYAMIGLGSQATGLVTPYSDLEFAILVEDETKQHVTYFRNLTHYLHLKVINLGETILPAIAIKCLNDFYSDDPMENWYYDAVTPRGFAFDGAMPHACKTPLGRGTSELIRTPSNMVKVLKDDITLYLKKGYHLATVLGNVSLITGEQGLVDEYMSLWNQQLEDNDGILSFIEAITTLTENAPTFEKRDLTANLLNVKKEIYRFSSLAVSCWALLHSIKPTTIWETIQKLLGNGVVNCENAHHLMVMVSISAELRLRTYMNNGGQVENMSALSSMSTDTDIETRLKKVFYFSNRKQLMRYYYTTRPLKHFISQLRINLQQEQSIFFDNSSKLKAEIYESLWDYENFKTYAEKALQENRSHYGEHTNHVDISKSLNMLGRAWNGLCNRSQAVNCYNQTLQMNRHLYGDVHPDIAGSLHNLGTTCGLIGDHENAISYNEQSLQMRQRIYGEDTAHADIADSFNNLGEVWSDRGNYKKATEYYEQSLQMRRDIFGEETAHLDIANSLIRLGNVWRNHSGDYKKAMNYYEQALQMGRSIYGKDTAHPIIASCLENLGNIRSDLGKYRKAIDYYEQSLQMKRSIYGEDTEHLDIAGSLNNLGLAWSNLGDHKKAIRYHKKSLKMMRSIYGEDIAHSDIADSLNNFGITWWNLGDNDEAISYYEQSLQMRRTIHGENEEHPAIADSLNNMGKALVDKGEDSDGWSYYERSLKMRRSIYGEDAVHPDIADSLNNVGVAWTGRGDHRKAIDHYRQSLQMKRSIYGIVKRL